MPRRTRSQASRRAWATRKRMTAARRDGNDPSSRKTAAPAGELVTGFTEEEFAFLGFIAEEVNALLDGPSPIGVIETETTPVADSDCPPATDQGRSTARASFNRR
jgi:hypothetical protein